MRTIVWLVAAATLSSTPAAAQTPDAASPSSTMSSNALVTPAAPSTIQPVVSPEIQQYFDKNILMKDRIRHSFSVKQPVPGQDTVDCIQDDSPPPSVPPSPPTTIPPSSLPPVPGLLSNTAQDGTMDPFGRVRACPAGTFGQVRPSISKLAGYETVAEWKAAQVAAHSGGLPQASDHLGYNHAVAAQYVNNWGMSSDISFQNPTLNYENKDAYYKSEHSLSQLWLVGHGPEPGQGMPADLQTIEIGWEETYSQQWAGLPPYLFISASWNAYGGMCSDDGCANVGPVQWTKTDPSYTYGTTISVAPYTFRSQVLPNHGVFAIYGNRTDGNWYVYIINSWVGYFTFSSGPLSATNLKNGTVPSNFIEIGGEIFEGSSLDTLPVGTPHSYTQMGIGGYIVVNPNVNPNNDKLMLDNNAFAACNYYVDGTGTWQVASPATSITRPNGNTWNGVTRSVCYGGWVQNNPSPSVTTTPYLVFGGPGPNDQTGVCQTY